MAFGGSDIKRKKESGEVICLADDLKAAATDSLKKAASLLGLGLHLYGDTVAVNAKPANGDNTQPAAAGGNGNGPATQANGNGKHNGNGQPPANGNGNGDSANGEDKSRLSSRQLGMILGLARERNISRDKLNRMAEEQFAGRRLEFISRSEASWLIQQLQQAA
jgi:hypothetical protein